mmetsp:Transcript_32182/g.85028  ORF Transcript_32182/g.85028 Transcript_32182/m.85028 type:complete len:249 (-) Transcript_32182:60-806(-)
MFSGEAACQSEAAAPPWLECTSASAGSAASPPERPMPSSSVPAGNAAWPSATPPSAPAALGTFSAMPPVAARPAGLDAAMRPTVASASRAAASAFMSSCIPGGKLAGIPSWEASPASPWSGSPPSKSSSPASSTSVSTMPLTSAWSGVPWSASASTWWWAAAPSPAWSSFKVASAEPVWGSAPKRKSPWPRGGAEPRRESGITPASCTSDRKAARAEGTSDKKAARAVVVEVVEAPPPGRPCSATGMA